MELTKYKNTVFFITYMSKSDEFSFNDEKLQALANGLKISLGKNEKSSKFFVRSKKTLV